MKDSARRVELSISEPIMEHSVDSMRLLLHLASWKKASEAKYVTSGRVCILDAYTKFNEQASAVFNSAESLGDSALHLLGSCYMLPPDIAEAGWLKVYGKFRWASAYLIPTGKLAELIAAGEQALASGAEVEPEDILQAVFAEQIYGAWPPLAWLRAMPEGEGRRKERFDAQGLQLEMPHAIAHLPLVGRRETENHSTSQLMNKLPPLRPTLGVVTAWHVEDDFPRLLNAAHLLGTVVATGSGDGEFAGRCLSQWRGRRWVAVDQWREREPADWLDVRNDPRPGVWRNRRQLVEELGAREPRFQIMDAPEAQVAAEFADGSVDAVWLDGDHSWQGMLQSLNLWWPKVREGGIMAGTAAEDRFTGKMEGPYTWSLAESALSHWAAQHGVQIFPAKGPGMVWMIPKFTPPRPEDITVITGTTRNVDYAELTTDNHREYCARHGYRYRCFTDEDFAQDRALCWSKVKFTQEALRDSLWVFWLDVDAVFNNYEQPLAHYCWPAFLVICGLWLDGNQGRPSYGTMLFQQSPDTDRLLIETWARPGQGYGDQHEEGAMRDALLAHPALQEKVLAYDQPELNSVPPNGPWHAGQFILHFMGVRGTRKALIADALAMGRDRRMTTRIEKRVLPAVGWDSRATVLAFRSGVEAVDAYLAKGYREVRGMSSEFAAAVVGRLMKIQTEAGIGGGVVEIGTFMGRFFIAMAKALEPGEIAVVIDHFTWPGPEVQERFEANCAYFQIPPEQRVTLAADSRTLTPETLRTACQGPARLIHIDGEHTPPHLLSDLALSTAVRAERGLLVLDDMLHPAYPLLGQTVQAFLTAQPELQVLAVIDRQDISGATKYVLGRAEDREFYESSLRRAFPQFVCSLRAEFPDHTALILTPDPRLEPIS